MNLCNRSDVAREGWKKRTCCKGEITSPGLKHNRFTGVSEAGISVAQKGCNSFITLLVIKNGRLILSDRGLRKLSTSYFHMMIY